MRHLTARQVIYLVLAALGAILPWRYNLEFMAASDGAFDLAAFVAGGFTNPAGSSITVDFFIVATAFLIWLVVEARRLGIRYWWVFIILMGTVAAAFAFPLFLFVRERRLAQMALAGPSISGAPTAPN